MDRMIAIDASQFEAVMKELEDLGFEESLTAPVLDGGDPDLGLKTKLVSGYVPKEKEDAIRSVQGVLALFTPSGDMVVS